MDKQVEIAIIGGGSTGSSILYHLAKRGVNDAVLLEKGAQIASGQTSRSTALLRSHYSIPTVAKMAWDSYQFFKKFEEDMHTSCGFRKTGLFVCGDAVTENALVANSQMLREIGIISEAIDKEEAKKIEPYLNVSIFTKIVYEPESGYADPSMTASAFAGAAKELGSNVLTNTQVQGIKKFSSEKGYEISTNHGNIRANKVIVAMGPWSKTFFATLGISVPIKPVRHPVAYLSETGGVLRQSSANFRFSEGSILQARG